MLLSIHPDNPQDRLIQQVVHCLRNDGVIIYPTDTVYGLGCDINSKKAVQRICQIKNLNPKKAKLSIVCADMSQISDYSRQINNALFRTMKSVLPGPFTFILPASQHLPPTFRNKKKTIGIRIPDHNIALDLTKALGHPIVSTSLNKNEDDIQEYYTNAELIHERYENQVDIVVDGGIGGLVASTIIDATSADLEIIRQGSGEIEL